jgi:hypothetical protein
MKMLKLRPLILPPVGKNPVVSESCPWLESSPKEYMTKNSIRKYILRLVSNLGLLILPNISKAIGMKKHKLTYSGINKKSSG